VYLTHYSRVAEVGRLAADLHKDVEAFIAIGEAHFGEEEAKERIRHALHDHLTRRLEAHGTKLDPETRETWLEMDVNLDAAGLVAWHERRMRHK
jgi:hypothetical protein